MLTRRSEFQTARLRFLPDDVSTWINKFEHDFSEQRQVLWRIVAAHGRGMLAGVQIEHLVQAVLDSPVRAHCLRKALDAEPPRTDDVAPLKFSHFLAPFVALTVDATYPPAVGPPLRLDRTTCVEPTGDLSDHAPVCAFNAAVPANAGPCVRADEANLQRPVPMLAGWPSPSAAVRFTGTDGGNNRFFATHRVDAHQQPMQAQTTCSSGLHVPPDPCPQLPSMATTPFNADARSPTQRRNTCSGCLGPGMRNSRSKVSEEATPLP